VQVAPVFHSDGIIGLHFTVRDTGRGVAIDRFERAVQPFGQPDDINAHPVGGAGLGLAFSNRLIGLLGGCLWAESAQGAGTNIHFTATFGRVNASKPFPSDLECLRGGSVLIADNSLISRRSLAHLVARWQMIPTLAASMPEATELIRRALTAGTPFDIVLVDSQMLGDAGSELAKEVRGNPELCGPELLVLNASNVVSVTDLTREVCPRSHLVKPVLESALLKAVSAAMRAKNDRKESVPASVPAAVRRSHILLAEDSAINQVVTARILKDAGYQVTIAGTGAQAVEAFGRSGLDLVLMDVQLPDMSGLDVTRMIRLKESATGEHVPILAFTAHAMAGDRDRCLVAGMDDYVSKPVAACELRRVVRQWLESAQTSLP
jgi:two-component system, sensor histidine kinase and response regulator